MESLPSSVPQQKRNGLAHNGKSAASVARKFFDGKMIASVMEERKALSVNNNGIRDSVSDMASTMDERDDVVAPRDITDDNEAHTGRYIDEPSAMEERRKANGVKKRMDEKEEAS